MRLNHLILVLVVATGLACGGRQKKSTNAAPGTSAADAAATFGQTDDGRPGWITRGSVAVVKEDGRRVFYGVGVASGIKNPSLLRSTGDNRARNELAKVFEVFSASLMKDYMSSSGEQNVEQAVKTAVSASLKGVEVVDRYIMDDGSMYALAALDLQRLKDVLAAEKSGAVKSFVTKVDVDDIFDQHGKKPPPPPPPPRVAAQDAGTPAPGAPTAPPSATAKVRVRSGKRPDWIDGEDVNFPYSRYLCGVGFGPDRTTAENGAYAALSRIFVARVASVSQDFMGAYSKTGAESLEVQSSETLTKLSTGKVFSGVQLMEVWSGGSTTYGLACLERAKAGRILREQIAGADEMAGRYLEQAKAADKASRVGLLAKALDAIVQREALNGELRIVDVDGVGVSGPYSHVDVSSAFEAAVEALRVGVRVNGPYDDDFRTAFIEALTKRGYKVTDVAAGNEGNLDVLVNAKIRVEDGGAGIRSARGLFFARAVVLAEVKNVAANKVIATVDEKKQEGHRSKEEAERKAVRKLAKKITHKVGAKIDKAMTGR